MSQKKVFISSFVILIILDISIVLASCITPTRGMHINADTTLCMGNYTMGEGLIVVSDGITLDCNGSTLTCDDLGYPAHNGINLIERNNVTIKNCNLIKYRYGINLQPMFKN